MGGHGQATCGQDGCMYLLLLMSWRAGEPSDVTVDFDQRTGTH
ncbi:MAG: hypothetical protein ACI91Q_002902, partial [Gammaproteobacteria bacterium]